MTTVMNAPDKAEHRALAGDRLRHKQKQLVNKDDLDLQELSYEDLFVQPVVRQLPEGQFVAGGDLWTDVDWYFTLKPSFTQLFWLFGAIFASATSNLLDFYLT